MHRRLCALPAVWPEVSEPACIFLCRRSIGLRLWLPVRRLHFGRLLINSGRFSLPRLAHPRPFARLVQRTEDGWLLLSVDYTGSRSRTQRHNQQQRLPDVTLPD